MKLRLGGSGNGNGSEKETSASDTSNTSNKLDASALLAKTSLGNLAGIEDGGVCCWRGVPYAKPLAPERRFAPPEPVEPWDGILEADEYSGVCPQKNLLRRNISEECLSLNIWSPAPDKKRRPVLFFIHGGAFAHGAGSESVYNGAQLAHDGDAVVVTINYRLGLLGFADFTELDPDGVYGFSGNCGLQDVLAALKWVREHIENFGGDGGNITVIGQSAGGTMAAVLATIPAARPYVHRCMMMSGGPTQLQGKDDCSSFTREFLSYAEIDRAEQLLEKSLSDLMKLQKGFVADSGLGSAAFRLAVDGDLIPEYPIPAAMSSAPPIAETASAAATDVPSKTAAKTTSRTPSKTAPETADKSADGGNVDGGNGGNGVDGGNDADGGNQSPVPLLIGTTQEEMSFMQFRILEKSIDVERIMQDGLKLETTEAAEKLSRGYRDYYGEQHGRVMLYTDLLFRISSVWLAEAFCRTQEKPPVWMYRFDFETAILRINGLQAFHATDLPFLFGTFDSILAKPLFLLDRDMEKIRSVSEMMQRDVLQFARTGRLPWESCSGGKTPARCYDMPPTVQPCVPDEIRKLYDGTAYKRRSFTPGINPAPQN